jgi:hypothetical protein
VAGLLDYLYDPSTYGGNGGLLSRLMPSIGTIPQSQGFPQQEQAPQPAQNPIAVGNYQMPRVGNADQFMPQQAMTPPNATPTQGQLPQQPQGFGGFLNAFNENLQNMGNGGSLIGALTGQVPNNQTAQFLVSKGIEPALAKTIVSDPGLLRSVLPQVLGTGGQTDDIKEYQFAKREEPGLTFQQFMQRKRAVSGEYSLTPQYGTDAKGNTVLIQTGKSGEAIQTKLPEGVKISSGVDKVDLGTQWGIIDKRTGQMVGTQPKDIAGKESAEKRGQAQGTAQAALANGADIDAEETKKKIDQFINNKGFNEVFGQLDQYRPKWSHSNAGADALARYEQLTGVSFLSAYQMLKGGGAITDIEGQKAGAAMARLNRAQGEEEAKQALLDFKEAVDTGLRKLRRAANGGQEQNVPQAQAAPKRIRLNADGTIAQ